MAGAQKAKNAAPTRPCSNKRRRSERTDEWFLIDAFMFAYTNRETEGKIQSEMKHVPKSDRPVKVFP
jgi:hypothetical protein